MMSTSMEPISSSPVAQQPLRPHKRRRLLYVISVGASPSERIICTSPKALFTCGYDHACRQSEPDDCRWLGAEGTWMELPLREISGSGGVHETDNKLHVLCGPVTQR